jgi:prepilin-type processing-associated H-X9-DG protein
MVVIAIVVLLSGLIFPAVHRAHMAAQQVFCANNLRQLFLANEMYADDHGYYVAAGSDMFGPNNHRWHGVRAGGGQPFDASKGPLAPYLNQQTGIQRCPSFKNHKNSSDANAFESSCGGYGYNAIGVGSQTYQKGYGSEAVKQGIAQSDLRSSPRTIMFADCAFPQPYGSNPEYLIEYSFAEPYHWVFEPGVESGYRPDPSIHFRHRGRANVVWCDGHVSSEKMTTMAEEHFTEKDIGWFGEDNNKLFAP